MNILISVGVILGLALIAGFGLTFWYILAGSDGRYEIEDEDD